MTPEQRLFQSVVLTAVMDATNESETSRDALMNKRDADAWLRGNRKDYRLICSMAGMDPDFVREAYLAGRIDRELIRKAVTK